MFENDFETMLRKYGDAVADRKRFQGLIKDYFPDQTKTVNLMMMAYDTGIATDIQSAMRINNAFAFRFVKQLTDDYGLSRVNADWVVSTWCVCYGQNVLGKECEIQLQTGKAPAIDSEDTENSHPGKNYGDLFRYSKSLQGDGLAVTGFSGDTEQVVIFQNRNQGKPVIEVGESIFDGANVGEAIITDGYLFIGRKAFAGNVRLHQVVMPYTLIEIGDYAFEGCERLKRVNLTERLERIGEGAFAGSGLKTIEFPKTLYHIGARAFARCGELDSITITAGIDKLSDRMFEDCTNLKKIRLSEGLAEIGDKTFFGCRSLDIIAIPDSVKRIGNAVFEGTHDKFILQCSFGSYAEEYARIHRIKYQLI